MDGLELVELREVQQQTKEASIPRISNITDRYADGGVGDDRRRKQTDNHSDSRPDLDFPDRVRSPAPPAAPKPDRPTYEAARHAELDRIRRLDAQHFQLLHRLNGQLHHDQHNEDYDVWDRRERSAQDRKGHEQPDFEIWISIRVLTHAIEGYLLGCAGPSTLTGAIAIRMPFDVDELIARLLEEEDMLIKKCGPPWEE